MPTTTFPSPPTLKPPRFGTERDFRFESWGGRTARVARALGTPFMPWQRQASALLNEHDGKRRIHPMMVASTQRQAGKTTWVRAEAVTRCILQPAAKVWYTANTGNAAREKWLEITDLLLAGPLATKLKRTLTNGSERLVFLPNGSQFRPFPPTRDSLHGEQSDLVIIDECWNFDPIRGSELINAIGPTQATRPGAQIVLTSTMGDASAIWWHTYCDQGRLGKLPYLEWSAPEGTAPSDAETLAAHHPAVPELISPRFLEEQLELMDAEPGSYLRAYGNLRTSAKERVIPRELWIRQVSTAVFPRTPAPCFGIDVAMDRSRAAIVACAAGHIEVIESASDVGWVVPRLLELKDRWTPAAIVVDSVGPSANVHDALVRAGVTLLPVTAKSYAMSCQAFLDGLSSREVWYRRHPALDAAADAAARRTIGTDGWGWGRRAAAAPICELTASTHAYYGDQHRPKPAVRPLAAAG